MTGGFVNEQILQTFQETFGRQKGLAAQASEIFPQF